MEARKDPEMERMKNERVEGEGDELIRDAYKIAYVIHFFLGAGNLLPWNTLITAIDYFGYLYPTRHVEKVFSVAYMISSLMVVVMMLSWGNWSRKFNFRFRMNLGFSMFVLSLVVTPVIDWSHHGTTTTAGGSGGSSLEVTSLSYYLSVASVVICGLADGLIGGTLVGSAGKLPKQYMQAIFAGTASSGVLVCILRISTKASLPHTTRGLKISAHIYFAVCAVVLIGCIICCNLLYKLPIMGGYYKTIAQEEDRPCSRTKFWEVTRLIQCPAFGVFTIYTVTLSIFPGFLAENIESKYFKDWYPILLITVFNVSDLIGKTLTAVCVLHGVGKPTWGSVARILFYPLFSACLHGPKWLKTEMPVAFLTALLGLSNGYLTSCVMILAPKSVLSSQAETAAIVMVVFLGLGLVTGSLLGWFWLI